MSRLSFHAFNSNRHPELVSGSIGSSSREVATWMLKQVQHDEHEKAKP